MKKLRLSFESKENLTKPTSWIIRQWPCSPRSLNVHNYMFCQSDSVTSFLLFEFTSVEQNSQAPKVCFGLSFMRGKPIDASVSLNE